MSSISSLTRGLAAVAALLAGTAAAQAPANDSCAGAELLTLASPGSVTSSVATRFDLAAAAVETAFTCSAGSVKNSVWYTFTPTVSGVYRMDTCGPVTNFDTVIQAYSGSCGTLTPVGTTSTGCNDQGGCTFANASAIALPLTAGTRYFVQVAVWSSVTLAPDLVTALTVTREFAPANDRCDGTVPAVTLNTPLAFSTNSATDNDSELGGNLDGGAGPTCFVGFGNSTTASSNASPGRDVVFSFTPPSTGRYNVRLGAPNTSVNHVLYLTDSCVAAMTPPQLYSPPQCIAAANRGGSSTTAAEELSCVPLNNGTQYFLWADEGTASTAGASYELEVTSCNLELEPNDTPASAAPLACPVTAGITDAGTDVDFFALGTQPAGARVFAMLESQAAGNAGSSSNDFDLRVTTATSTLEFDLGDLDSPFGSSAGNVSGTPLPAGVPTYLRVNYASTTSPREPYRLYSVVQTGTATPEIEPNEHPRAASGGASNYFSGDVSSDTDVDVFAFEARAGDLVHLSLDSQPSRTGSTSTGNHSLQLLDRTVQVPADGGLPFATALVAVNDFNTTVDNTVPSTPSLTATTPFMPSESLVYRVRTNGTYFARVGRTSTTGSGAYLLSIARDCAPGGGIGAPTLASLSPVSGSMSGNVSLTLTGSNFSGASTVLVGGSPATVISRTATTIQVLTPPGNAGAVDVSVVNPGAQTSTLTGGYLYTSPAGPPTVSAISPATGPTSGGTVITLTGLLFKPGAEVSLEVGGTAVPATNVVLTNSTLLRATTPAHAAGAARVIVRNPADALEGSLAAGFTYLAPPAVSSITPNSGFTSGGITITLSGTNFRPGAQVRFGANAGTSVVVDASGTSLTVIAPSALVNGPVNVTVINTDTQQVVVTGGFTYNYPLPTLLSVTPATGFAVGGTPITIVGTGFQPSPTVLVGGTLATNIVRSSLTQVTAVTPPGAAGLADVTVTNPDLQSATRTGAFRYVPAPSLSSISPSNGAVQGGTRITLTGQNFQAGATVRLGAVPAFAVTVTSPTTATAITNTNVAGPADVVLTNPDTQSSTLAGGFTFDGAPTLTALSPISGTTAGGTVVTLSGTGFGASTAVSFGTGASPTVTLVSPTQLTAVTPAASVGVVTVTVRNGDNQSASIIGGFRFVAPPTLTAAAPNSGDVGGGTVVRLTGAGFASSTTVSFGGTPAAQVSLVSATELDAVTPRHLPGVVDVQVSTDGAIATLTGGFTFTRSAPTLVAVAPVSGPIAGGTLLTLSGTGFAPGATVTVGGGAATDLVIVSDVLARVVVPAHAAGAVDVVFTNDDAQAATLAGGFTYVAPPSNNAGTVTDGGSGSIGGDPTDVPAPGGVSCGCTSVDGSMFSMAGFGLLMVLSRRRRRS
ncbi:MAG: IPT/TIG domain-containing protein [Archangium sp.]|nr:IPT/TIG domain-containing protein [Archangium sp.]